MHGATSPIPNDHHDNPKGNDIISHIEKFRNSLKNKDPYIKIFKILDSKENDFIENKFFKFENKIILTDFRRYFDEEYQDIPTNKSKEWWADFPVENKPIPKYKKTDWKHNDTNTIPYIIIQQETKKPEREKSKYVDGEHSIQHKNLERFVDMAVAVVSEIWEKILERHYGQSFVHLGVNFFDGIVTTHTNKAGKQREFYSPIFHKTGEIHMSRQLLGFIDFHTTRESAIGLTLSIAHEVGHSIARQLWMNLSRSDEENLADFIAGYTLRAMKEMGLLSEEDISMAKMFFYSIGTLPELRVGEKVHDTPEGRVAHLMRGYESDIKGVKNEFSRYTISTKNVEKFMNTILSQNTSKKELH